MKRYILTSTLGLICLCFFQALAAQHDLIDAYQWDPKPVVPDTVLSMDDATTFLERHVIMDRVLEDDNMVEYYLLHSSLYLRDQGSVDRNNTVRFVLNDLLDKPTIRARSMNAAGNVVELKEADFNYAEDEESGQRTLYFAFEGLDPGSVVEYILIRKKSADLQGDLEYLQRGIPTIAQSVQLASPVGWSMGCKSYNGAPELAFVEREEEDYWLWRLETGIIPGMDEQLAAAGELYKPRVDIRLEGIHGKSSKTYSSFVNASKLYHRTVHPELDKSTKKAISKLGKEMQIHLARNEEDRIRTIESFVKTNFGYYESGNPVLSDLSSVLSNQVANDMGMCRLLAALFQEHEIAYELVVNCNRFERVIDPDFETFLPLQEIFFYLPGLDAYLDPGAMAYRVPYVQPGLMATDALHIRQYDLGEGTTGVGKLRYVSALPDTFNLHDHYFDVVLSDDASSASIAYENHLMGYYGTLQSYYELLDLDRQEELAADMMEYLTEDADEESMLVLYGKDEYVGKQPLVMKGNISTTRFSGSAGDRRLFNIGELIGPQVEMYDSVQRTLPVEESFNRRFLREFDVRIPAGWSLRNPEDLVFDVRLEQDGDVPMAFISEYTLEDNKLHVRVHEYYRTVRLPLERYAEYRAVINAAADFNKVTLVLAPE